MDEFYNDKTGAQEEPGYSWIDRPGGDMPIFVDVKLRNGHVYYRRLANALDWSNNYGNSDIVAYRISGVEQSASNAAKEGPVLPNDQLGADHKAPLDKIRQWQYCKNPPTQNTHAHYFKNVSKLSTIDVYRVLELFNVTDPVLQHIAKKALCAGERGHKDLQRDIQDIFDSAKRKLEMLNEDNRE